MVRLTFWMTTAAAAFALTFASPPPVTAQISDALLEQYRQRGARLGLTPAQVTQVFRFIDSNESVIVAAARENRVNEQAFRAIALELGLRNYGGDPNLLVDAIVDRAEDAAKYETQIANLRSLIEAMQNSAARTPAEVALARAEAAYQSGDLDGAEAALDQLIDLRSGELVEAFDAWEAAHRTAMELANSRGQIEKLEALVRQARDARRVRRERQAALDRMADWQDQVTLAHAYYEKQFLGGDLAALQKAISIYRDDALPLVKRESHPVEWAFTQYRLGFTIKGLEFYSDYSKGSDAAIAALRLSLEVLTPENTPQLWIEAQSNLIVALENLGDRDGEMERVQERLAISRSVINAENSQMDRYWVGLIHVSLASALLDLDKLEGQTGTEYLRSADQAYRSGILELEKSKQIYFPVLTSVKFIYAQNLEALETRSGARHWLDQAVTVYQTILEDLGRTERPLPWARVRLAQAEAMFKIAEEGHDFELALKIMKQIDEIENILEQNPDDRLSNGIRNLSAKVQNLAAQRNWTLPNSQ